jgi:hypothetical protein
MIDMKAAAMLGGDPADRKEASYWPNTKTSQRTFSWSGSLNCRGPAESQCRLWSARWRPRRFWLPQRRRTAMPPGTPSGRRLCNSCNRQGRRRPALICNTLWRVGWRPSRWRTGTRTGRRPIAKQFNVTRAAVSKRVVEIRKAANPQTIARSQKSISARKTYALRQLIVGQTRTKIDLTNQQKETNNLWDTN